MSENPLEKRLHLVPPAIASLMLLGALGYWPYGYYQLLRFVVCGISAYTAFMVYEWQKQWAAWLFGFIAIVFNPLIPMHLPRELWQMIDVVCAFLFVAIIFLVRKANKRRVEDA